MKHLLPILFLLVGCGVDARYAEHGTWQIWGPDATHRYFTVSCGESKMYCYRRASIACNGPWTEVSSDDSSHSETHGRTNQYGARVDSDQVREWSMLIRCEDKKDVR